MLILFHHQFSQVTSNFKLKMKRLSQLKDCDNIAIIDYFQAKNVLHKGRYCPKCLADGQRIKMKIAVRADVSDGYGWRWRCNRIW